MSTPYLNTCLNYLFTDVDTLFKDMFKLYLKKCLNENRVFDVMLKYFLNMFRMTQNGSKCIQRVKKLKTLKYFPEEILTLFNLTHLCTNFVLVLFGLVLDIRRKKKRKETSTKFVHRCVRLNKVKISSAYFENIGVF